VAKKGQTRTGAVIVQCGLSVAHEVNNSSLATGNFVASIPC